MTVERADQGRTDTAPSREESETPRYPNTVLIVDPDQETSSEIANAFVKQGYKVLKATTESDILNYLSLPYRPEFIILNTDLQTAKWTEILDKVKKAHADTGVLITTSKTDFVDEAIQATKLSADFMSKPFDLEALVASVDKFFEEKKTKAESAVSAFNPFEIMIGQDPALLRVVERIRLIAPSDASVLITGETGTGKELVAQCLHLLSRRRQGQLVKVAISTLPESLVESELFGHEKGSFTSAYQQRKGRFELADKGTMFLDEIGEMSKLTQMKLLRVLQEHEFERVGGTHTIKVDTRVVAATNRNLADEVKNGNFREDLYYRLKVVRIHLPPLRERKDDIPLLIDHFLKKHTYTPEHPAAQVSEQAMGALMGHHWTGNIRELENVIRGAVVLSSGGTITPEHLDLEP